MYPNSKKNLSLESKISTEQKLALIRTVRLQQQYNRNRCREREKILYGKSIADSELFASESDMNISPALGQEYHTFSTSQSPFWSSVRMRFLMATILFVIYLFADKNQTQFLQKDSNDIRYMIQENFELSEKIPAWNSIDL